MIEPEAQAEFDVVTLGPGEDRMVWLVHEGRKLGRVIHVKEGDDKNGPVVVTLEPSATITGRIVDADGNPVSGATIRPGLKPGGDFSLSLPQVASGSDGRFTVPNVPTGCDYSLVAESGAKITQRRVRIQGCRRPTGRNHGRRRHPIEGLTTSGSFPRGADSDEPIAMVSVSTERECPLGPGSRLDAPPPGRLRRDLGRATARPGRAAPSGGRPGPRRHRPHSGHARRNSPRRPICWATRPPAAATSAGSRPGGCYRMLFTPDPLTERLTLVWHDHFATSQLKVEDVDAMRRQNETFRRHARGPFGDLLRAMLRDPALLAWLDAPSNRKGKPNENLARELMELFTLGVGQFSERDVKEVARALTGRTVVQGRYAVRPGLARRCAKDHPGQDRPLRRRQARGPPAPAAGHGSTAGLAAVPGVPGRERR